MASELKRILRPVTRRVRTTVYAGTGRDCPCCGRSFRRFRTVGRPRRADTACPYCSSVERHRMLALLIAEQPGVVTGRVLHFAPEAAVTPLVRSCATEYVTTDLSQQSDVQADIVDLPFSDARWDTIVCSHVLEHVPDDARAMRELHRVLAPGGHAIILVPRNIGVPTDEDPNVTDPHERVRRFGQVDHVRMYGDDLEDRLRAAGFESIRPLQPGAFTADQVLRHRLEPVNAGAGEVFFICR